MVATSLFEYLIFDLDGTISDPKEGIVRSFNYALAAHGFAEMPEHELVQYIGPPLDTSFSHATGSDDAQLVTSLVAKYRERYTEVGFSENILYADIPEVLAQLVQTPGLKLGVCTSKRVDFATRILELFNLEAYFTFVDGGDVGIQKWQQLQALKEEGVVTDKSLMIGDRNVDLTAAHKNGLQSAGVLWGHGSLQELQEHTPAYLFSSPRELLSLVS